jgi:ElaA protein
MPDLEIEWKCTPFSELTNIELYKILQLRSEVFVIEQNCIYQDMDNKDFESYHLCGWQNTKLAAYSRLLPPGISFENEASIGRVLTSPAARRKDMGKYLMERSIMEIPRLFGPVPIVISAQLYLKRFYEVFLFVQISDVYLEDNIPHIKMKRAL